MSVPGSGKPGFAICLTYHLPNVSGLTLSAHELGRHLCELGHKVRVIAGRIPADLPKHSIVDGVEVVRSPALFRLGKALFMPTYAIDVWRSLDDIAVVNVHLPCLDAAAVAIVAKLRGRKLIVSYVSSMSRATWSDKLMRAIAAVPHVIAGFLADRIQVVSTDYAEASTFCRLFRHKLRPAPLPIYLRLFSDEEYPPRKRRKVGRQARYRIGYVGRIARQKSLAVLVDSLPLIERMLGQPVIVELVGPAEQVIGETYWTGILSAVEKSGGSIRYRGVLSGKELAEFYAGLDVLVLPSIDRLESFGLVQIEAMLRRVPVVASDLPGMRVPVARTGMGRLFKPGDPSALASAVVDVLTNGPDFDPDADSIDALFGHSVSCKPYLELLAEVTVGHGEEI